MGLFLIRLFAIGILLSVGYIRLVVASSHDESIDWQTWGPYRPDLYFGVRPQIPETFLMGLMWASGDDRYRLMESMSLTTVFCVTALRHIIMYPVRYAYMIVQRSATHASRTMA